MAAGNAQDRLWSRLQAGWRRGVRTAAPLWPYYLLMYAVGVFHLAEVHLLDPAAGALVDAVGGADVVLFAPIEAPIYEALETAWSPEWVAGVTAYYLAGFVALLVWTPHLVALEGDRDRLKSALLTYPLLYLLALPGYLFLPQLNPYVALALADPFSPLAANLETGYYLFTTPDNTFPSLHVGFTAALTVHLMRSSSDLVAGAAAVHGTVLVASVVYLRVHWIGDVLGGLLVAWAAIVLADRAAAGEGRLGAIVDRLDEWGRRGLWWAWRRRRG